MYGYSDFLLGSFSCQENKQIYAELSGQIICSKWQNLSAFFNQANAVPQKALKFSVDGRTMSFGTQGYFAHVTYRVENYFSDTRFDAHLNFEDGGPAGFQFINGHLYHSAVYFGKTV